MNRVTPEDIEQAYLTCGLTPIQGAFIEFAEGNKVGACCGLTALYLRETGVDALSQNIAAHEQSCYEEGEDFDEGFADCLIEEWANIAYGKSYTKGFIAGFDDCYNPPAFAASKDWDEGYADGKNAAERMLRKEDA
jgi:hypothetical protein